MSSSGTCTSCTSRSSLIVTGKRRDFETAPFMLLPCGLIKTFRITFFIVYLSKWTFTACDALKGRLAIKCEAFLDPLDRLHAVQGPRLAANLLRWHYLFIAPPSTPENKKLFTLHKSFSCKCFTTMKRIWCPKSLQWKIVKVHIRTRVDGKSLFIMIAFECLWNYL